VPASAETKYPRTKFRSWAIGDSIAQKGRTGDAPKYVTIMGALYTSWNALLVDMRASMRILLNETI
jgi:hypothetical protein